MTRKIPANASVARSSGGARLSAPAAARNAAHLCDLLEKVAPTKGKALEIASGTGQHVLAFAKALPRITWQPTEIASDRIASIDAYRSDAPDLAILPPRRLDATTAEWHRAFEPVDLVVLVNLLHLISDEQATTVIGEAVKALTPGGRFVLYGPFRRGGHLTSEGDARFDADLRGADPTIGYKNDDDVARALKEAGCSDVERIEMPANNLAFVAQR